MYVWYMLLNTSHSPLPHTTTVLRPFFRDHPGEPVPEENFWTLWCKGRLTEADTPTIRLGTTPYGLTSAHLHHPPIFLQAGCLSRRPTNSVKALKASHLLTHKPKQHLKAKWRIGRLVQRPYWKCTGLFLSSGAGLGLKTEGWDEVDLPSSFCLNSR